MKFFQIIVLALMSSCTHREGVDYPVGNRSYDMALMSGHGYFAPVHTPNYLPPNPPPNFTPPPQPNFIPLHPQSRQSFDPYDVTLKTQ
jgi:hypothetical protein